MTRVLHVAESFAAGVSSAIRAYVSSVPEAEHLLLYAARADAPSQPEDFEQFVEVAQLPTAHRARVRSIRRAVQSNGIDVLHLHSSYAGVYGRLALRKDREVRLVYTPHCFAFERATTTRLARAATRLAERALAQNTSAFAACSLREKALALELGFHGQIEFVPHVLPEVQGRSTSIEARRPVIVTVGRLSPQKDPELFAAIARATQSVMPEARFLWIGGVGSSWTDILRDSGVEITGWQTRESVMQVLSESDVYVHPARWEGYPVAILEAVAAGVPSIVVNRAYAAGSPSEALFSDVDSAVRLIQKISQPGGSSTNLHAWREALSDHTPEVQGRRLRAAYGMHD